jgi:hypothetical protein
MEYTTGRSSGKGVNRNDWIEKLLQTPIYSGRATAIERIFCPYLIRRMSKEQAYIIIREWLDKCLALPNARPMNPSKRWKGYIEYYLDKAITLKDDYSYLKLETVKFVHPDLYDSIMRMQEIIYNRGLIREYIVYTS